AASSPVNSWLFSFISSRATNRPFSSSKSARRTFVPPTSPARIIVSLAGPGTGGSGGIEKPPGTSGGVLRQRGLVDEEVDVSLGRFAEARRRAGVGAKDVRQRLPLVRAGDEECDAASGVDQGQGEGHARRRRLRRVRDGDDESLLLVEGGMRRKERGGMTVGP